MAMVAQELGPTWLVARDDGPVWGPAGKFGVHVGVLDRRPMNDATIAEWRRADGHPVVWVCKGTHPLDNIVARLLKRMPELTVILDLDDDDRGLAVMFKKSSLRNWLTLHPLHRMNPIRIARSQSRIGRIAHGFTFSTTALRSAFPSWFVPATRIPHVRHQSELTPMRWSGGPVRVGLLGTIRAHKGGHLVQPLIDADESIEVYAFERSGVSVTGRNAGRFHELAVGMPLDRVYAMIDVSLIAIDSSNRGARLQLPAKLVDSMSFGVPIVATATPAIKEVLGEEGGYLADADDPVALGQLLRDAAGKDISAMRARFAATLTPRAAASQLSVLLAEIHIPTSVLRKSASPNEESE